MPKRNKTSPPTATVAAPMDPSIAGTSTFAGAGHASNRPIAAAASSAVGLPTPAQSTEIHAKSTLSALSLDAAFTLPPAAISSPPNSRTSSVVSSDKGESDSSYQPDRFAAVVASKGKQAAKRKSSAGKVTTAKLDYTVPPPPTRPRKIIQMKPRLPNSNDTRDGSHMAIPQDDGIFKNEEDEEETVHTNAATGSKRKQAASATTAQGRKMARKTAHSLIERRRRSKMNEEFGVLKDMIPACAGQELHKLAILQASIEYMRYLEKCLADLKTVHSTCPQTRSPTFHQLSRAPTTHPSTRSPSTTPPSEDSDVLDLPPIRQVLATYAPNSRSLSHVPKPQPQTQARYPPISPSSRPLNSAHGSPLHNGQYQPPVPRTCSSSTQPSPLFEGQQQRRSSLHKLGSFSLTSPIVPPMRHLVEAQQEEATAALLMLNTDRRSWSERGSFEAAAAGRRVSQAAAVTPPNGASARSMSVRDLLAG